MRLKLGAIRLLFTAALAARRGKRVVVLSQGPADGAVKLGGREWRLDDAPLISLASPLAKRVFEELGLLAQIQRRRRRIPGHFHVALDGKRLDVFGEDRSWESEATRAFPQDPIHEALEQLSAPFAALTQPSTNCSTRTQSSAPQAFGPGVS